MRALARLAGWLALALAVGFLGHSLWQSAPWTLAAARAGELGPAIGAGVIAYAGAGLLLAEAWRLLLGPGAIAPPPPSYRALYGRTQIAKYLPGNCFHFVGRQLLGRRFGHGHGALALASFAETASLLAVAGALALPLLGHELAQARDPLPLWLILALLAGAGLGAAGARAGRERLASASCRMLALIGPLTPRLLKAGLLHLAFFAVGGLILWLLAVAVRPDAAAIPLITAVSALALAWAAGFVVPGAAAGVGVREAVLVLFLEPHLGAPGAVLAALALRVVTTVGDLVFFGLCLLTPLQVAKSPNDAVTKYMSRVNVK